VRLLVEPQTGRLEPRVTPISLFTSIALRQR
jgi:hypothetical protein